MNRMISSSCEPTREESDVGEEEPCGCCGYGGLEVLGEAPASAEPGEGAFDDPSSGQPLEAFDALWALDDFDGPRPAVARKSVAKGESVSVRLDLGGGRSIKKKN